jgi:hypothetical protein
MKWNNPFNHSPEIITLILLILLGLLSLLHSQLILPEHNNGAMHKYIIICDQRYGGTWFTTLLREQVNRSNDEIIHMEGELFQKKDLKDSNLCQRIKTEFFDSSKCNGRKICSCRVPYFVWFSCDFISLANDEQIQFIHIVRENKIDWYISHAVASELRSKMKIMNLTAAQVMHCKENEKCYADDVNKLKINPREAIKVMRNQSLLDKNITITLQQSNIRHRSLIYEDIVVMGTPLALDFMGINVTETNQAATTKFKKRITKAQVDIIQNYGQFVNAIKKTEFRWYLDYCIENIGKPNHC